MWTAGMGSRDFSKVWGKEVEWVHLLPERVLHRQQRGESACTKSNPWCLHQGQSGCTGEEMSSREILKIAQRLAVTGQVEEEANSCDGSRAWVSHLTSMLLFLPLKLWECASSALEVSSRIVLWHAYCELSQVFLFWQCYRFPEARPLPVIGQASTFPELHPQPLMCWDRILPCIPDSP